MSENSNISTLVLKNDSTLSKKKIVNIIQMQIIQYLNQKIWK